MQVSPTLCVLPQGVQRERLAHVSCLQGVVGYTATDADRDPRMAPPGGGVMPGPVFPQWRLRGKAWIAARTAASGAVYFVLSHSKYFTEHPQLLRKEGCHPVLLRGCQRKKERQTNGKFCDTQD